MEAGRERLTRESVRDATRHEIQALRWENDELKQLVADLSLEVHLRRLEPVIRVEVAQPFVVPPDLTWLYPNRPPTSTAVFCVYWKPRKLLAQGVQVSMNGKGRCMVNVFVERLWRSIKYEEVYLKAYQNGTEARKGIGAYLAFYNQERPHQALSYRSPGQVFQAASPHPRSTPTWHCS